MGLKLGIKTDTLDITGKTVSEREVVVKDDEFGEALCRFIGEQMQLPPMYSAIKVNGQKLYELARKGEETPRDRRKIEIYGIELLTKKVDTHEYSLQVTCSKGTYIRTLVDDIGSYLGCGAVMTSLLRTKSGCFSLDEAIALDEAAEIPIAERLMPLDTALVSFPVVKVENAHSKKIINGCPAVPSADYMLADGEIYRVYDEEHFLALCRAENGYLFPVTVFGV